MRPCTSSAGFRDWSMKRTPRDLAYGERYAAGMGPDTFVGFSADHLLAGVCVSVFLFKRTSTFAGIQFGPFWDWLQRRSTFHPQACHLPYGPSQPNLSAEGSVGECLSDSAIIDTRAHAGSSVGDRYTSVREQHTRSCSFTLAFGSVSSSLQSFGVYRFISD